MTKDRHEKKLIKDYPLHAEKISEAKEPVASYFTALKKSAPKHILTKDFVCSDFKKIADKAPFTIGEWADILHISERTLHRYAKTILRSTDAIERILHIEKLIRLGNTMFGKEGFKNWLYHAPSH
ncbi:hypothetical protein EMGBS15_11690 [Filimonas sp.]|nr:hypothetical protein EMGBS15_11690 [Filimonas sp.]